MGRQEQRAWTMAGVSALAYAGYLAVVFHRARGGSLAEASYVAPLLWAVGAAVLATILADMALGMISRQSHRSDQRDREIHRFGEYVGHSFIVLGGVTALVLAMTEQHPF